MLKETPIGNILNGEPFVCHDWVIVFKRQIKETTRRNYLSIWNASCVELTYKGYGTSGADSN